MRTTIVFALLATMLVCSLFATPLYASGSTSEAWVSGTFGNDSNASTSCQRTAPCATLSTALGVTSPGGIVFCADPSATIGPMTISQDVTIDCSATGGVVNLSCLGGNGIIISTAGINVTLRGLTVVGPPCAMAQFGIDITAAATVRMEQCKISGFTTAGVEIATSAGNIDVKIQDSTITKNGGGVLITPTGGASVVMSVERSLIENSTGGGLKATGSGGPITLSVSESSISQNGANGLNAVSSSSNVMVNLSRDVIASNGLTGVQANGGNAAVTVDNTSILNNATAVSAVGGGRILTYGNNRIVGTLGSGFTGTTPLQ
jgi:Right handed beta helix region